MTMYRYESPLADAIQGLIRQKQAMGYRYAGEARVLYRFDQFVQEQGLEDVRLDQSLVNAWNQRRSHEAPATWSHRRTPVRQLALYMTEMGLPAYVPPTGGTSKVPRYVPHIYSDTELRAFFHQVDACRYHAEIPYRHWTLPVLFRVLYGTGLRLSEALHLRLEDVDDQAGILTIRDGKFHKDRLIPVAASLRQRLAMYRQQVHRFSSPDTVFFLGSPDRPLTGGNVYKNFRRFLWRAGISHGGWSKGPRVHDFRYPNLNKIPTFFENPVRAAFCTPKGWDFFFTVSVGSHHRMPLGSRFHFSIAWIPLGPPRLPRWPRLFVLVRG